MSTDKIKSNVPETIDHIFNLKTHLKFILLHINIKCHHGHTEFQCLTNTSIFGKFGSSHCYCNTNDLKWVELDMSLLLSFVNEIHPLLSVYLLLFS